ncbi:hypothetical protein Rleg4DRAFT_6998 [Rhizobium leguminosarum bv. trifolii WSM2297]|uniref:Transcriptional regulator n=2 Tax=Rhizobium leguminosarum TaxID=384 RepID=J0WGJ0_RHILT|nr:hypothetical protein Rleg4DRAFT_5024 [Rhizobium leguminosarum bv. trifolii WSM2297]EJC85131.1 hypothetical protein Rleg4DRAFT_6998 [Rhizobium leguminosarum bv. trifolii WSM2297]
MPFLPVGHQASKPVGDVPLIEEEQVKVLLTPPIEQHTTASALQETKMADENDTMTDAGTLVAAAPDVAKKVRKPRARKAAPEAVSVAVSAQPAAASNAAEGKQKRGRKAKSDEGLMRAKRAPIKRAPKTMPTAAAASTVAVDEISDLLQLEEENQRLRKLLAEKLRAENADLRKRLNLA